MQAEVRQPRSEQLAALLRKRLLAEELLPGASLPPERQLAVELGTNRNTLREALRKLEALGLVHAHQGRGVVVTAFRDEGQLSLLPHFLLEGSDPLERLRLLDDVLRLRRVALAEAVELAAVRGGAAAGPQLRRLLRHVEEVMRGGEILAVVQADLALYRAIAAASGSLAVTWTFNSFQSMFDTGLEQLSVLWTLPPEYLTGLRELVDRIAAADGPGARRCLLRHLGATDARLVELIGSLLEAGARAGAPVSGRPTAQDSVSDPSEAGRTHAQL